MRRPKRDEWEQRLAELRAFRHRFGHCRVPVNWAENRALAKWVVVQQHRWGRLPRARLRRLYDLGFSFSKGDRQWLSMFLELVVYQSRHGHCLVPARWTGNLSLGCWVHEQRKRELNTAPRQQLTALGFDWAPLETNWEQRFSELKQFKDRYGHCRVPPHWTENPALADWVRYLRARAPTPARRQRLTALGFDWALRRTRWEQRFSELKEFKNRYGHCRVPLHWTENPTLALWTRTLRVHKNRVSPQNRRRLDALGFVWSREQLREKIWEDHFRKLQEFCHRCGHCRVPARWRDNSALASWVSEQRYLRKHLRPDQRRRLDALGFVWNVHGSFWEQRFVELQQFRAQHGHCRVPANWRENRRLGQWVSQQRIHYRHGRLPSERKARLNAIGFEWRRFRLDWEDRFAELRQFRARYGHCRVPAGWKQNRSLADWVRRQRNHRAQLSSHQRRQLDKLGFDWDPFGTRWERGFAKLREFRARHGHCHRPTPSRGADFLSRWMSFQRWRWRGGRIPDGQKARLDALGFVWRPRRARRTMRRRQS